MRLPIADCRLPVRKSLSRRSFARGSHSAGLDEQFDPKCSFIRLLLDRTDLGEEFDLPAGATTRAIVRCDRSSTPHDLFGADASCIVISLNRPGQFDDSQGKGFGASLQFRWIHNSKFQIQPATGNRQPAMRL